MGCSDTRAENMADREAGEYVKGERRKSRNIYELEKALAEAGNDNEQIKAALNQERKKDAALALRGRNLAQLQARARDSLVQGHKSRKDALARQLQRGMNKTKAEVREAFRPEWRKLRSHQDSERKTFEALETSFFGRASNVAKAVRLSAQDIGGQRPGIISRTFRILTNAGERKAYFEASQERARKAVQRQQADKVPRPQNRLKPPRWQNWAITGLFSRPSVPSWSKRSRSSRQNLRMLGKRAQQIEKRYMIL